MLNGVLELLSADVNGNSMQSSDEQRLGLKQKIMDVYKWESKYALNF